MIETLNAIYALDSNGDPIEPVPRTRYQNRERRKLFENPPPMPHDETRQSVEDKAIEAYHASGNKDDYFKVFRDHKKKKK